MWHEVDNIIITSPAILILSQLAPFLISEVDLVEDQVMELQ